MAQRVAQEINLAQIFEGTSVRQAFTQAWLATSSRSSKSLRKSTTRSPTDAAGLIASRRSTRLVDGSIAFLLARSKTGDWACIASSGLTVPGRRGLWRPLVPVRSAAESPRKLE